MRKLVLSLAFALATAGAAFAATPDQEKAFVDTYQKAFDAKDAAGLKKLLSTEGADPMALEFYSQMITAELADGKLVSITLVALTKEDEAKAAQVMDGPGGKMKLSPKPYKKLVLKIETKTKDMSSTSSSEVFVADVKGKLLISVPVKAK